MRIGELENRSGTSRHTLRYYEEVGLINTQRQANNYRCYNEQAVQDIAFIQQAQSMGFSLAEIAAILDAKRDQQIDCAQGAELVAKKMSEISEKIAGLQTMYRFLDNERLRLQSAAFARQSLKL